MPVKIIKNPPQGIKGFMGGGSLQITQFQLTLSQAFYSTYYRNSNGNADFCDDIMIKWKELKNLADAQPFPEDYLALKFIHRYDVASHKLYLAVQFCELAVSVETDPAYTVFDIVTHGDVYDLYTGNIPSVSTLIDVDASVGLYDPAYYNNVIDNSTGANVVLGTNINSIVLPWKKEIKAMHDNNGLSDTLDNVFIKFASCSFDFLSDMPARSKVRWPHGLVAYMNVGGMGGNDLLGDNFYVSLFVDTGANFGTLCPPRCGYYDAPAAIVIP